MTTIVTETLKSLVCVSMIWCGDEIFVMLAILCWWR